MLFKTVKHMADNDKTDGLNFAITLLVAFGSIGSATIIYFQNNAVDIKYYGYSVTLLSSIFGLIFFLLFYIFIKGASMEMPDPKYTALKGKTDKFAAVTYSVAFLLFLMLFPLIVITIILLIMGIERNSIYSYVMYFFSYIFGITIGWPNIVYIRDSLIDLWNTIREALTRIKGSIVFNDFKTLFGHIIAIMILILSVLIWTMSLSVSLFSPLQGQVTIDMGNIYYKNDSSIPATIQLTGPNTGISINLSKSDSEHNLTQIDSIKQLEPIHISKITVSGNISANYLEKGKYNVFINTNNLSQGYYELDAIRIGYTRNDIKGFYLLNDRNSSYSIP